MAMIAHVLSNMARHRARCVERQAIATTLAVCSRTAPACVAAAAIAIAAAARAAARRHRADQSPAIARSVRLRLERILCRRSSRPRVGQFELDARRPAFPARPACTSRSIPSTSTGSFFAGLQAGYNYMLPNRLLLGAEVDASFPGLPKSRRLLDRRHLELDVADARRGNLQRDGARFRHGARPHRLCARPLAVLRDRRICLDLRSADADAARHRHHRTTVPVAIGLGGGRRRRGADCAALDRAA